MSEYEETIEDTKLSKIFDPIALKHRKNKGQKTCSNINTFFPTEEKKQEAIRRFEAIEKIASERAIEIAKTNGIPDYLEKSLFTYWEAESNEYISANDFEKSPNFVEMYEYNQKLLTTAPTRESINKSLLEDELTQDELLYAAEKSYNGRGRETTTTFLGKDIVHCINNGVALHCTKCNAKTPVHGFSLEEIMKCICMCNRGEYKSSEDHALDQLNITNLKVTTMEDVAENLSKLNLEDEEEQVNDSKDSKPKIIFITGNIGSGKTTLCKNLKKFDDIIVSNEPIGSKVKDFYTNRLDPDWVFNFESEMSAQFTKVFTNAVSRAKRENKKVVIFDRSSFDNGFISELFESKDEYTIKLMRALRLFSLDNISWIWESFDCYFLVNDAFDVLKCYSNLKKRKDPNLHIISPQFLYKMNFRMKNLIEMFNFPSNKVFYTSDKNKQLKNFIKIFPQFKKSIKDILVEIKDFI